MRTLSRLKELDSLRTQHENALVQAEDAEHRASLYQSELQQFEQQLRERVEAEQKLKERLEAVEFEYQNLQEVHNNMLKAHNQPVILRVGGESRNKGNQDQIIHWLKKHEDWISQFIGDPERTKKLVTGSVQRDH
ncbi:hypothetical protein [Alicyclobacillus herbarius]|uniref:hypothetical protein n=1 Tax=Alicyclobacillus herbarius TaxID=122960 RepID=UPI00041BC742|nr:hypothetical protein [Alicyclobacillus herbarius]